MAINLNISEQVAAGLLKSLESKVSENQAVIDSLTKENDELLVNINLLKESMNPSAYLATASSEYHKQWTIFRKVVFLIQKHHRPLSTKEMVDYIINDHEPELKPTRNKLVSAISGVLSTKTKEGRIIRQQNLFGENVFHMPADKTETPDFNSFMGVNL